MTPWDTTNFNLIHILPLYSLIPRVLPFLSEMALSCSLPCETYHFSLFLFLVSFIRHILEGDIGIVSRANHIRILALIVLYFQCSLIISWSLQSLPNSSLLSLWMGGGSVGGRVPVNGHPPVVLQPDDVVVVTPPTPVTATRPSHASRSVSDKYRIDEEAGRIRDRRGDSLKSTAETILALKEKRRSYGKGGD